MPQADAAEWFLLPAGQPHTNWRNEAWVTSSNGEYDPACALAHLKCPVPFVVATGDLQAPPEEAEIALSLTEPDSAIVRIEGHHFTPYTGEALQVAADVACDFFLKFLRVQVPAAKCSTMNSGLACLRDSCSNDFPRKVEVMSAAKIDKERFESRDLKPTIGTALYTTIEELLSGNIADQIRGLLQKRIVVVFPKLNPTDEQQTVVAGTIGTVQHDGADAILKITIELNANGTISPDVFAPTRYWHIDNATRGLPAMAGILTARRVSSVGGQTEFANLYAAYEALPDADKQLVAGLRAVHSFETFQRCAKPDPTVAELTFWQSMKPRALPMVWTHGDGRKSLFIGSTASHVEGMEPEEGRMLLCRLQEWATQDQFIYRHEWTVGDMLIWNNTGAMHRAVPYPQDSGRLMSRSGIVGVEAFG